MVTHFNVMEVYKKFIVNKDSIGGMFLAYALIIDRPNITCCFDVKLIKQYTPLLIARAYVIQR